MVVKDGRGWDNSQEKPFWLNSNSPVGCSMVDLAPGWQVRCLRCGLHVPAGQAGIIRLGAYGKSYKLGWCWRCRWVRCFVVERSKRDRGTRPGKHQTNNVLLLAVTAFVLAMASPVVHAQIRRPTEVRSVSLSAIISTLLAVAAAIVVAVVIVRWLQMRG